MKRNIISPKFQLETNTETTLSQGVEIVFGNRIMVLVQLLEEQQKQGILTPESIHNLRVTCRRLISACTLLKKLASKRLIAKIETKSKKLLEVLAPLQNWNLLKSKINSFNSSNSNQDSFFHGIIWAYQNNSYNKVIEISKKKFADIIIWGRKVISKISKQKRLNPSPSFHEFLLLNLMKASDEFQECITTGGYDINSLHKLRLKTKLLRHCLEIAENAVPEEKFVVVYNELKSGQKLLGNLNNLNFQINEVKLLETNLKLQGKSNLIMNESELIKNWEEEFELSLKKIHQWKISIQNGGLL